MLHLPPSGRDDATICQSRPLTCRAQTPTAFPCASTATSVEKPLSPVAAVTEGSQPAAEALPAVAASAAKITASSLIVPLVTATPYHRMDTV